MYLAVQPDAHDLHPKKLVILLSLFTSGFANVYMRWLSAKGSILWYTKTGKEESKLLQGSIPNSTAYKTKLAIKIFHQWQINRKVTGPVLEERTQGHVHFAKDSRFATWRVGCVQVASW